MKNISLSMKSLDIVSKEAYRVLRTNLMFCGKDIKTVVITSCTENDGKSTVCVNLAHALAEFGKKVLLIDGDLRKSVLATKITDVTEVNGLSQYLSGMSELEQSIYHIDNLNFDIIFAGIFPPNPCELLGSASFKSLIEKVGSEYDYVLVDTPPIGIVIDSAVVGSVCDASIIVANSGKTKENSLHEAIDKMNNSGAHVIGCVLNNSKSNKKGRHGYQYYYSHEIRSKGKK